MLGAKEKRILNVDLESLTFNTQQLENKLLKSYFGGSGLATRFLFEMTSSQTRPLSPENPLIFMTGLLTGTPVPASSRYSVVAISPKTGIFGESNSSGFWGPEVRQAGYDGIIIEGRATSPVYLWIDNGKLEIRDADHLWGKETFETDNLVRAETDDKAKVVCIGPAGEKLIPSAVILNDGINARVAGRTGMGAVMGSKLLKAIAVRGTDRITVHDQKTLRTSVKEMIPSIKSKAQRMGDFGTAQGVESYELIGNLPIKNWRKGSWKDGAHKISGEQLARTILSAKYHCKGCPIGCGRVIKINKGEYAGLEGAGPEYETIAFFGSMCLVDDLEAICKANELCNRYGIDTMSTGAAIAFAMEAYEKKLLTKEDLGGVALEWGNAKSMVEMVQKIANQQDFGKLLGRGVREAAEALGPQAQNFAIHVKGLEPSAHDPRCFHSAAIGYATGNRGACHLQGGTHWAEAGIAIPELGWQEPFNRFGTEGKGEMVTKMQNLMSLFDALGVCKFLLFGGVRPGDLVGWLNLVTGWAFGLDEFMKVGERIYNLKRLFNVRQGIGRKDDLLPMRFLTQRRGEGGAPMELPNFGAMLADYYAFRGWDEDGIPTKEKLTELELIKYLNFDQRKEK